MVVRVLTEHPLVRELAEPLTHCPPGIGVATTFGTGPVLQWRWPTGVETARVFIASATAFLSFGLPLAFRAATPTSKRARLGPICWFQYLPLTFVNPPASALFVIPVSDEAYGHVGPQ